MSNFLDDFVSSVGNFFSVDDSYTPETPLSSPDAIKTGGALSDLGYFGANGESEFSLPNSVKAFQDANGLKVDGIINKGGPTEKAISGALEQQSLNTTNPMEAVNDSTPSNVTVSKPVSSNPDQKSFTASASFGPKPKSVVKPKIDPMTGVADPLANAPKANKSMTKAWDDYYKTQEQKAQTAIVPKGNTTQQALMSLMQDPRYNDKNDTRLREHVVKQFERAYPGEVQYDETGKMVQPTAVITPDQIEAFDPDGALSVNKPMFGGEGADVLIGGSGDDLLEQDESEFNFTVSDGQQMTSPKETTYNEAYPVDGAGYTGERYKDIPKKPTYGNANKTTHRVSGEDWKAWHKAMDELGVSDTERQVYADIFSNEGGQQKDKHGTAVAGITKDALKNFLNNKSTKAQAEKIGISADTNPEDLTPQQQIQFYRLYLDDAMRAAGKGLGNVPGHKVLDQIGDSNIAAAVADTLFREGGSPTKGPRVIQVAVNNYYKNMGLSTRIGTKGGFGSETRKALQNIAKDPKQHKMFLSNLSNQRNTYQNELNNIETNKIGTLVTLDAISNSFAALRQGVPTIKKENKTVIDLEKALALISKNPRMTQEYTDQLRRSRSKLQKEINKIESGKRNLKGESYRSRMFLNRLAKSNK
ncbi:MAG: hypothetical protein HWE34_04090 [Methylocystaceae bacterium]|nr:hypothetical protein [Methylocystaceae bacterium]